MQVRLETEGLVVVHAPFGQVLLGNTARGQRLLHICLRNQQRLRHLGFLVKLDAFAELIVDGLDHVQVAVLPQSGGQQGLEAFFLLRRGHRHRGIEEGFNQGILAHLDVVGIVQRIVDIGGPIVKGREQKAQHRGGHRLIHGSIVEEFLLRHIVEIGLGLLHRADSADEIGIHLLRLVGIRNVVLSLKGHIIAVAANEDQVVSLQSHGIDDLLEEAVEQLVVGELAFPQIHQQLVLRGPLGHLGSLEGQINEVLADRAGQHPLEQGKILVSLVLRHHAGALAELCNDLPVVIDKTAVDFCNIAAVPPQMAADLADFLIVHGATSVQKNPKKRRSSTDDLLLVRVTGFEPAAS